MTVMDFVVMITADAIFILFLALSMGLFNKSTAQQLNRTHPKRFSRDNMSKLHWSFEALFLAATLLVMYVIASYDTVFATFIFVLWLIHWIVTATFRLKVLKTLT